MKAQYSLTNVNCKPMAAMTELELQWISEKAEYYLQRN
jgi:hypothetical protein